MSDEEMEDYGFEYSEEDEPEEDEQIETENTYYSAKAAEESEDYAGALEGFKKVVALESEKGEWGFKSYKQIVKVYYKMGKTEEMLAAYRELLAYTQIAVTRNQSEKKLNSLLDTVSNSTDVQLLQGFYQITLESLGENSTANERLWFKTNLKLCGLWFRTREYGRATRTLKELHRSCQEAKPYKSDPEVSAMTDLVDAYQRNNITEFEKTLKNNRRTIMADNFISQYIEDLLKNIRTQVVLKLIQPYTRIRIPFVSKQLNIPAADVEQLLVSLILDNRIAGRLDQVNHLLELEDRGRGTEKYGAIHSWATQLDALQNTIVNKLI